MWRLLYRGGAIDFGRWLAVKQGEKFESAWEQLPATMEALFHKSSDLDVCFPISRKQSNSFSGLRIRLFSQDQRHAIASASQGNTSSLHHNSLGGCYTFADQSCYTFSGHR